MVKENIKPVALHATWTSKRKLRCTNVSQSVDANSRYNEMLRQVKSKILKLFARIQHVTTFTVVGGK